MPQTFVGGEVSPEMFGRPDDPRTQGGAARLRNVLVKPNGCAPDRPGTEFVHEARGHDTRFRLFPFRYSGSLVVHVEVGLRQEYPATSAVAGYCRFHAQGGTVLYARAWSAAQAYAVGDQVLQAGVLYRCVFAHTNHAPPDITYWRSLEYVANRPFAAGAAAPPTSGIVTGTPGEIYFGSGVNHGLASNEPVEFTGDAGTTAPAGVVYGTVYYAIVVDAERIRLAATPGGAAIAITSVGSGTFHRMHRHYTAAELVSFGAAAWYLRATRPIDGSGLSIAPGTNETFWYAMPATLEYEIGTDLALTEDQLFEMTCSQDGDKLSLATSAAPLSELVRQDETSWTWAPAVLAPTLPAPTGLVATRVYGEAVVIDQIQHPTVNGYSYLRCATGATGITHRLSRGQPVLVLAVVNGITNGEYIVAEPTGPSGQANEFALMRQDGTKVTSVVTAPTAVAGAVRAITLGRESTNSYRVTAIDGDGAESQPSSIVTVTINNLSTPGARNNLAWNAVAGAKRYRVYKESSLASGLFGWIGETEGSTGFVDDDIAPRLDLTPPILDNTLDNQNPAAVAHFESRRAVAVGQDVWLTRSNTDSDLSYSLPVKATDRIHQRLRSRVPATIRHLVPLGQLVALTDTCEFRISAASGDALTPDSFAARPQSYVGAAPVQPEVVGNVIVFAGAAGGHVYEMGWRDEAGGYVTLDLCERSAHLFDRLRIVQMTKGTAPWPVLWHVQSNGRLLGLTYVPGQAVVAWHQHDTDGTFETASAGPEGGEDRLYLGVRRTVDVGGVPTTRRYIERLRPLASAELADSWRVDCGLEYSGVPTSVITGLSMLEGKTVTVFADGVEQARQVVIGGQVVLESAASRVVVGLPIESEWQTPPAVFNVEAYGSGRPKSVTKVYVRIQDSGSFEVGTDLAMMDVHEVPAGERFTGIVEVPVPSGWLFDGQLFLRNRSARPLNVVSITAELAVGG